MSQRTSIPAESQQSGGGRLSIPSFPSTRYQGSKRRLAVQIADLIGDLGDTALDAFGGTGAVSYALKQRGLSVTYNDILRFNQEIGRALIENDHGQLTEPALRRLFDAAANDGTNAAPNAPRNFIEDTYDGIFFTRAENRWLDNAVCHISRVGDAFERSMFWFCLFQAALAKRPYNLFHRANLYMRQADVPRSFGNKASWDRSFEDHMTKFARELNRAVFAGTSTCHAFCDDALNLSPSFDLVYIDTPYISGRRAAVDYRDFYHFLEGLVHYDQWSKMIDWSSKHRRMQNMDNPWCKADSCLPAFQSLFRHYADANIAVSYRSHGIPSIDELVAALGSVKPRVSVHELGVHQYALSTEKKNQEMLIVGTDN